MKEEFKPPYYKLIKVDGYRYVVDDNIKVGDKVRINFPSIDSHLEERTIHKLYTNPFDGSLMYMLNDTGAYLKPEECFKPIASNNPALPDLLWLPEPDGQEDGLQKLLNKWKNSLVISRDDIYHTACERIIKDLEELIAAKGKGTYSEDGVKDILMRAMFRSDDEFRCSNTFKRQMVDEWWDMNVPKPEPIGVELLHSPAPFEDQLCTDGKKSVIVKRWIYE